MCKLHGVRLIKGIKVFESILENLPFLLTNQLRVSSQHWIAVITVCYGKILG